jgi:hypothetical protein
MRHGISEKCWLLTVAGFRNIAQFNTSTVPYNHAHKITNPSILLSIATVYQWHKVLHSRTIVFWLGSSKSGSLHDHISPNKKHPFGVLTRHMSKCHHKNLASTAAAAATSSPSFPTSVDLVPMRRNTVCPLSRPRPRRLRRPKKSQAHGLHGLKYFQLGYARPLDGS